MACQIADGGWWKLASAVAVCFSGSSAPTITTIRISTAITATAIKTYFIGPPLTWFVPPAIRSAPSKSVWRRFLHEFPCRLSEKRQTTDRLSALTGRKPREHSLDAIGIEYGLGVAHARTRGRKCERNASRVATVARAQDVPLTNKPLDGDRHRRRRHAHVTSEVHEWKCLLFVEVVQNARLMGAQDSARRRIAHVTRVAGEENL